MTQVSNKRDTVLNAFRPGSAMDAPERFAGRKREIETLVDTLYMDGACPIIYGERGLGKTSLALQIQRIALGDTELLDELGWPDRVLPESGRFTTFYFSCSDGISTKDELLQRLINTASGYDTHETLPHLLESRKLTTKLNLKLFAHEVEESYSRGGPSHSYESLSVEEKFEAVAGKVLEKSNSRVFFIIDELDRLRDNRGLASVIKNLSSHEIKFLLVGVGQNVSTLLHDHASLERTLVQIKVSGMKQDECSSIIHKAELLLEKAGISLRFSDEAVSQIVEAAGGFPWFVHTIAQESLKLASESDIPVVTTDQVDSAIKKLSSRRFGQQFYDTYQMAVGDSMQREMVLRLFAKWGPPDLPTSDLYPIAHKLGVVNPAALAKQLMKAEYGGVLVRPPYAPARVFRFTNAMFKRYVELRDSVYRAARNRVDAAWANHVQRVDGPEQQPTDSN